MLLAATGFQRVAQANKKPEAMHTIKTYNMNSKPNHYSFYILSKGYNAGKPLEKPCPNCFLVSTDSEEHRANLFWVCYSLWKSGTFLPLLCGSVIPFLHIDDVRAQMSNAIEGMEFDSTRFRKTVYGLQQLIKTEALLEKQLRLIDEVKRAIAINLLNKNHY